MSKKKGVADADIVKPDAVETDEVIVDPHKDILAFIAANGRVHPSAIDVPHDPETVDAIVNHLKMTGKLNSDGSHVWL